MKKAFVVWEGAITVALFAFLCAGNFSCGTNSDEPHRLDLKGEVVSGDIFIGNPTSLLLYDNLILICDRYESKMLTIVDRNTFSLVGRHINEGRGPGEVTGRVEWSVLGDRLYAYQANGGGALNIYSLPDMAYIESVMIDNSSAAVRRMPDYYVGNSAIGEGRLQIFDKNGKYLFAGSDYPDSGNNISDSFRFAAYQGYYCTHPSENRYVFGGAYSDNIEFHAIRDGEHILVKEYKGVDVRATMDNEMIDISDDALLGYKGAWGGEKWCYMLYMGKTLAENEGRRTMWSDNVFLYTWDGELDTACKLDRSVRAIMVDEANGNLYGIARDDEGYQHIVKFKL
ncbi:MAG: TolB-like 6-bladed beta-propeller domain-containing protein [Alistipes sp.]|jgi:hypothetical protein|nr:TolB-like 6-bladed beta-propeller domain-containing protein [Alistipes sp.]